MFLSNPSARSSRPPRWCRRPAKGHGVCLAEIALAARQPDHPLQRPVRQRPDPHRLVVRGGDRKAFRRVRRDAMISAMWLGALIRSIGSDGSPSGCARPAPRQQRQSHREPSLPRPPHPSQSLLPSSVPRLRRQIGKRAPAQVVDLVQMASRRSLFALLKASQIASPASVIAFTRSGTTFTTSNRPGVAPSTLPTTWSLTKLVKAMRFSAAPCKGGGELLRLARVAAVDQVEAQRRDQPVELGLRIRVELDAADIKVGILAADGRQDNSALLAADRSFSRTATASDRAGASGVVFANSRVGITPIRVAATSNGRRRRVSREAGHVIRSLIDGPKPRLPLEVSFCQVLSISFSTGASRDWGIQPPVTRAVGSAYVSSPYRWGRRVLDGSQRRYLLGGP